MKDWAQKSGQEWKVMGLLPEANEGFTSIREIAYKVFFTIIVNNTF